MKGSSGTRPGRDNTKWLMRTAVIEQTPMLESSGSRSGVARWLMRVGAIRSSSKVQWVNYTDLSCDVMR